MCPPPTSDRVKNEVTSENCKGCIDKTKLGLVVNPEMEMKPKFTVTKTKAKENDEKKQTY
jgi:hypothetical protein